MAMTRLTLKFMNTSHSIAILQPFVAFYLKFLFILPMPLKKLFLFGVLELSSMFVMVVKARLVSSFIFMNVSLHTFMFGFHWMNFKWVFFVFLTLPLLNYILIAELLCKPFAFCVNIFHCLLIREFSLFL